MMEQAILRETVSPNILRDTTSSNMPVEFAPYILNDSATSPISSPTRLFFFRSVKCDALRSIIRIPILATAFGALMVGKFVNEHFEKLDKLRLLDEDWNGYGAPKPSDLALANSERFLRCLAQRIVNPTRVNASVVGGIGFTFRNGMKELFVEFENNGDAMYASGDVATGDEPTIAAFDTDDLDDILAVVDYFVNG